MRLSKKRGDHNVARRVLKTRRHKYWQTNYTARKQAMTREAKKAMKARAQAEVKRTVAAVKSKGESGILSRIKSIFKPRAARGA